VNDLTELVDATRRIAAQTRQRMAGTTPDGATGRVSLHDPDARPIAKGRLGKPVEFGAKAQVCDNADGIVLDHDVQPGKPADAPRLKPAVERVKKRTGQTPRTVAADRGYGEASVDDDLAGLGVRNVVIPRKGRPTKARQAHERRQSFRQTVKWRTGCEGRISHLKRSYGWDRTMIDTTEGARIWIGHAGRLCPHLAPTDDAGGSLRPQPHQHRHPHRLTGPNETPALPHDTPTRSTRIDRPRPIRVLQVEVAKRYNCSGLVLRRSAQAQMNTEHGDGVDRCADSFHVHRWFAPAIPDSKPAWTGAHSVSVLSSYYPSAIARRTVAS
jgi:IS5 family transposase